MENVARVKVKNTVEELINQCLEDGQWNRTSQSLRMVMYDLLMT